MRQKCTDERPPWLRGFRPFAPGLLATLAWACTVDIPVAEDAYACQRAPCPDGSGADTGPAGGDGDHAGEVGDEDAPADGGGDAAPDGAACSGAGTCPGGGPCVTAVCVGGACGLKVRPDGAGCDDGDGCTAGDTCELGACQAGAAIDCGDETVCTIDGCEAEGGCTHTPVDVGCDDGDPCTVGDACQGGACANGKPDDCDDGEGCTDDSCDPVTGCVHAAAPGPCEDGDACTAGDKCGGGVCLGGPATPCDDDSVCTDDACDKAVGCVHTAAGGACDDGDPCSLGEACDAGKCQGGKLTDCDDGKPCTVDTCDGAGGCTHVGATGGCDDGDKCTVGDKCVSGACVSGVAKTCDDNNACTTDDCNAAAGCVFLPLAVTCDDGDTCTTGDKCVQGTCTGKVTVSVACCAKVGGVGEGGHCVWVDKAGRKKTLVPPGPFWMGCNAAKDGKCAASEKPQHRVELSAYWLDLFEVTAGDYKACVAAGACVPPSTKYGTCTWGAAGKEKHPVNCLTWAQARAFCVWSGGDLPTEAQWEKGARGGCEHNGGDAGCQAGMRTWPWGEATPTCTHAVMFDGGSSGCGKSATWPVGQKTAGVGPYGAYDMAGGVLEWVRDGYDPGWYATWPPKSWPLDPWQAKAAPTRALRGGSWSSPGSALRSSQRMHFAPDSTFAYVGVRCVEAIP